MNSNSAKKPETLDKLQLGAEATVVGIDCDSNTLKTKLLSLGLVQSTNVKVVEIAPLGDPINISVRGFTLSLRRSEARSVLVNPL